MVGIHLILFLILSRLNLGRKLVGTLHLLSHDGLDEDVVAAGDDCCYGGDDGDY